MSQQVLSVTALLQEDESNREQALTYDSFIVEAPAGAGKTELLTQRYLKLLETVEEPEEIIAITFTNKAASEMKSRILDSLQMAADGKLPEQAHKQITFKLGQAVLRRSEALKWDLLDTPSRLRIYTIDSLSANLARQMPLLSRFGTQPGVRDDARPYYEEAVTRTLDHLEHADYGAIVHAALQYFDNDMFRLTQLLTEMLAKREQWLPYTQNQHTAQDAEQALANMINSEIAVAADVLNSGYQNTLMPIARYAASQIDPDHPIKRLLDWDKPLVATCDDLTQWQSVAELLLTKEGALRKRLDINMGLPPTNEAKPYKEALQELLASLQQVSGAETTLARLRKLPAPQQAENTWQIIATLAQLLHIAVGELWLVFQAHGEVDFVEVSQRALLALEDSAGNVTDLALKLDYRIQHLLVDEFQDTSPAQIKLIEALTRGWQAGDGRTLFCVGDPMQSIYRFRKANVGLFLRAVQQGIGNIHLKPLKLRLNNRSSPAVVEWVNHTFNSIFPNKDSISRGAIQYRPFVANKAEADYAGVTVHLIPNEKPDDDNAEETATDSRRLEADRIIEIIRQTRQQNPKADIAVLVRAREHLSALVAQIRRDYHDDPDLRFQAVEVEGLACRQAVQDLLSLTYALHHRADRVHWLAVLRAPWCGLTLADLHALVANDRDSTLMQLIQQEIRLSKLSDDGHQRLVHVYEVLNQALQHKGRQSVSRWIQGVWLMLGGADCLWDAGDVRDIQAFFAKIEALERTGQFSPQLLTTEVEKLYAAPDASADGNLQLMTIHKSKGLEFDTVILPGLNRGKASDDQPLLLWEEVPIQSPAGTASKTSLIVAPYMPKGHSKQVAVEVSAYDYLTMLEKERAVFEDARVLYVAATRAKRCLHLLGAVKQGKDGQIEVQNNTFLGLLRPALTKEQIIKLETAPQTKLAIPLKDFIPQLVRLKKPANPIKSFKNESLYHVHSDANEAQTDNTMPDADIGTLTHTYLQLIAEEGLEHWSKQRINHLKNAMQRWFKQRGYETNTIQASTARVISLLETSIASEQGRWVLSARAGAASELAIESYAEETFSKKIIDRTFVDDGVRWIIDYKTIDLSDDVTELALKDIATQYKTQLDAYAGLFANKDLPIKAAIFFVSIGRLFVY